MIKTLSNQPICRVPLFERLADDAPDQTSEAVPLRWHNTRTAAQSVCDELSRLLNTRRASLPRLNRASQAVAPDQLTIVDYGVADWSAFAITQPADYPRVERELCKLIACFEPRISGPQVHLSALPGQACSLHIQITGKLAGDADQEPAPVYGRGTERRHAQGRR